MHELIENLLHYLLIGCVSIFLAFVLGLGVCKIYDNFLMFLCGIGVVAGITGFGWCIDKVVSKYD